MKIEEESGSAKCRISLSMKHCNQSDGADRDPNGYEAEADERKRKPKSSSMGTEKFRSQKLFDYSV